MKYKNLETPCIGICSTIYGDEVCRGCKRSSDEVITWNISPPQRKAEILERLERLTTEATAKKLEITDPDLLKARLQETHIRFREAFSAYCWAYNLLRSEADKITDIASYGIAIKPEYRHLDMRQLINAIDDDLYQTSQQALRSTVRGK